MNTEKHCGRCGYTWRSEVERPSRCPHCGTYRWYGESVKYSCLSCGHTWFSRTELTPSRCPHCKTRSWRTGATRRGTHIIDPNSPLADEVCDMYLNGMGCVSIAIDTGLPMASIIETIRTTLCDGKTPRM